MIIILKCYRHTNFSRLKDEKVIRLNTQMSIQASIQFKPTFFLTQLIMCFVLFFYTKLFGAPDNDFFSFLPEHTAII